MARRWLDVRVPAACAAIVAVLLLAGHFRHFRESSSPYATLLWLATVIVGGGAIGWWLMAVLMEGDPDAEE